MYYSELFDIWFPKDNLPSNFDYQNARQSFLEGGFYQYNFADIDVSLIALNTMYFKEDNHC